MDENLSTLDEKFWLVALGFVLLASLMKAYFDFLRRPPRRYFDSESWSVEGELLQLKPRRIRSLYKQPMVGMLVLMLLFLSFSFQYSNPDMTTAEVIKTYFLGLAIAWGLYFLAHRYLKSEIRRQKFLLRQGDVCRAKIISKKHMGFRKSIIRIQFETKSRVNDLEFFASKTHWKEGEYVTLLFEKSQPRNAIIYQDALFRCEIKVQSEKSYG